jgi:hypothetical protein
MAAGRQPFPQFCMKIENYLSISTCSGWPPGNPPPVFGSKSPFPPSGVQPDNSSQAGLVFSAAFAALALYGGIQACLFLMSKLRSTDKIRHENL